MYICVYVVIIDSRSPSRQGQRSMGRPMGSATADKITGVNKGKGTVKSSVQGKYKMYRIFVWLLYLICYKISLIN